MRFGGEQEPVLGLAIRRGHCPRKQTYIYIFRVLSSVEVVVLTPYVIDFKFKPAWLNSSSHLNFQADS